MRRREFITLLGSTAAGFIAPTRRLLAQARKFRSESWRFRRRNRATWTPCVAACANAATRTDKIFRSTCDRREDRLISSPISPPSSSAAVSISLCHGPRPQQWRPKSLHRRYLSFLSAFLIRSMLDLLPIWRDPAAISPVSAISRLISALSWSSCSATSCQKPSLSVS